MFFFFNFQCIYVCWIAKGRTYFLFLVTSVTVFKELDTFLYFSFHISWICHFPFSTFFIYSRLLYFCWAFNLKIEIEKFNRSNFEHQLGFFPSIWTSSFGIPDVVPFLNIFLFTFLWFSSEFYVTKYNPYNLLPLYHIDHNWQPYNTPNQSDVNVLQLSFS